MSKFWNLINSYLKSQPKEAPKVPFIHEIYKPTEEELKSFTNWSSGKERKELLYWIHGEFSKHQHELERSDLSIDFLDTLSAKGFVIFLKKTNMSSESARHLIRFMMEKIKPFGYLVYMSDVRSREKNGRIEKTLRHYLKPRIKYDSNNKLIQLFGNISLEIIAFDGVDSQIRFSAINKRDHSMDQAIPISKLYECVIS